MPSADQRSPNAVDVIIIGGGPAGLTAALYLGRARKTVAVLDAGRPRHEASAAMHNFLTRDGMAPAALRVEAWRQMAPYPGVTHAAGVTVEALERRGDRWVADCGSAGRWSAPAALLATGVIDEHPDIPGYAARWGKAIHHCPFCHGWELQDEPLAVLADGATALHMAPLLRGWSADVTVLTHGRPVDEQTRAALDAAGIPIRTQAVVALEGAGDTLELIRFADGSHLRRRGLFVRTPQRQVPLVAGLGLDLDDAGYVKVDGMRQTSAPMLWAAGDLTTPGFQQVVSAAAQGGMAGGGITFALMSQGHP